MRNFLKWSGIVFVIFLSSALACGTGSVKKQVVSPDGKIVVTFLLKQGVPFYRISREGQVLIEPSRLGFRFKNASPLVNGLQIFQTKTRTFDETWKPVWGQDDHIRNHYNELKVTLREIAKTQRKMTLVFRAFNDGVGFRYILPEQPNLKKLQITDEVTEFNFAQNDTAWWIPADYDSYEKLYHKTLLTQIKAVNTPVTVETPNHLYLSVHEANLTDYAGMTLKRVDGTHFECNLVPWPDGVKVKGEAPLKTPWRTIQIATRPGGLIESHLIVNLNEPCALQDVSWIHPTKYVGIWWAMHIRKWTWTAGPKHGATTAHAKRYIDFASRHHIPALLVEGWNKGWESWGAKQVKFSFTEPYPDFDLKEIVRYGKAHGVALIGHHETGGNVPDYERQMDAGFRLCQKLGIPAVKTGYAGAIVPRGQHHHGQWMVRHYRKVIKTASKYHLMIDAHEPIKPTGIRRTYPNFIAREGVRGMEYNAWSDGNPPEHTTILPFTRVLAGPVDYTPGIFNILFDPSGKHRVHTTLAKQLALYVVLYSPLQMAADLVENYENQPAFKFIEVVPTNWNETRVLDSRIGDYVTIVRRNGENWFLGSITDEWPRLLDVPLAFLKSGQTYAAHIFADSKKTNWVTRPTPIDIGTYRVSQEDTLPVALSGSGGMAVWFEPISAARAGKLKSLAEFERTVPGKIAIWKKNARQSEGKW